MLLYIYSQLCIELLVFHFRTEQGVCIQGCKVHIQLMQISSFCLLKNKVYKGRRLLSFGM
jgi:hypothetical protein